MLTQNTIKLAVRIVKEVKRVLPDSKRYRQICEEVGVGQYKQRKIHLSHSEIRKLEAFLKKKVGASVLDVSLDFKDRMDAAKVVSQEKWAKGGVFSSMLSLCSLSSFIPIIGGNDIKTPVGTVISVMQNILDVARISNLVIVENGEVIVHWNRLAEVLPEHFEDAIFLYKGHGDNQAATLNVLTSLPANADVSLFFDYDAAGFDMALNFAKLRKVNLIVPKFLPCEILTFSKSNEYYKQHAQLIKRLDSPHTPQGVKKHLEVLKINQLAITQEHLIMHKIPLSVIELSVTELPKK